MTAELVAIVVVALSVAAIVLLVLAPWRNPRRDALGEEDYLALLAGEQPGESAGEDRDEERGEGLGGSADGRDDGGESGPSAGDVAIP